ncbi:hypothetical protein GH741_03250 [Aquibacillus halophilus]|uniref:Uncharacterized protein n=1 Tax=Aquibacillus halophilus TaxID=930132 RepID=A0A6A8DFQ3_9BACI|nr:hypothetical protein [Aquibacillus halophilus]MRH41687.1 hypothetical protein [Aquibacillus halophilus]
MVAVKLDTIIEGMELDMEEIQTYLNHETGEVVTLSSDALRMAEDDEPLENLLDWQQDEVKIAIEVVENWDIYTDLPSQFEIDDIG